MFYKIKCKLREKIITFRWREKLENKNFTIWSNDCTAGMLYHELAQRFNSPTIDLYLSAEDYLKLISNPKKYIYGTIKEIRNEQNVYPIGMIEDIKIHFVHYKNFNEACEKWQRRSKRINWDNMFFILNDRNGFSEKERIEFEKLPYQNKILMVHKSSGLPCEIVVPGFEKEESVGILVNFKNKLSLKRNYDCFDFVRWLNGKGFN